MVLLPSAKDVQKVNVARDPGVSVPAQAFDQGPGVGEALQVLGEGADQFAEVRQEEENRFAKIKQDQDNRRDAVDRSKRLNQSTAENDAKIAEFDNKFDLSDGKVLEEIGGFFVSRRQEILEEHRSQGASADSLAALESRLLDEEARATGIVSGISTKIGRDNLDSQYHKRKTGIGERAAAASTPEELRDIIHRQAQIEMGDLQGGYTTLDEREKLRDMQEYAVEEAARKMIRQGRIESAESLLISNDFNRYLSAEKQQQIRGEIQTHRYSKDKTTERQRRQQQLEDRGFSTALSQDIAAGDVRVVGPDELGEFYTVNLVDGTKSLVSDEDKRAIAPAVAEAAGEQPAEGTAAEPARQPLEEDIGKGTGPFAKIQAGLSNVFGPFMEGALFEDTTNSRQNIRLFSQTAKTALINNPKFPVAEQEVVAGLLPNPDRFFLDPDTARSDLGKLREFLTDKREAKRKESTRKISTKHKADLSDQISGIDEILSLMGQPEGKPQTVNTQKEVDKLPPGTKFIWGPTGGDFEKE